MNTDLSQKYCDEIMKYYNRQKKNNPESEKPDSVISRTESAETAKHYNTFSENTVTDEKPEMTTAISTADVKYPDPVIPGFILSDDSRTAYNAEPSSDISYGSLRIEASSGNHAIPVEDALIIITRADTPEEKILAVLLTDSSGATQTVRIPAPAEILSESPTDDTVSAVVNITAYKRGYYEIENRNVPVFTGVTSIQPVNMVPLPADASEQKAVFAEDKPNL